MKKEIPKPIDQDPAHSDRDMRPEYDFASMAGGVRGKYYKAYRAGHTVKIHHTNGTIEEQVFPAEEGVVILSEDVETF